MGLGSPLGLVGSLLLLLGGDYVCLPMLVFCSFWKVEVSRKSFQHMRRLCCPCVTTLTQTKGRICFSASLHNTQHLIHVGKYVSTHHSLLWVQNSQLEFV